MTSWSRGYRRFFFTLNSTEHEISTAYKTRLLRYKDVYQLKTLRCIHIANKY